MQVTLFKSAFDNRVEQSDQFTWPELVQFLSEHRRTDTKNDLGFVVGKFLDPGEAKEAKKPGSVSGETLPGTVGRLAENIEFMDALCLDYDGGSTIAQVRAELAGIRHVGYTSYSHLKDGTTEKFRVVILFDKSCPRAEWKKRFRVFLQYFPGVDQSAFALARIFFAPSTPASTELPTFTWSEDGEPFSWEEVPCEEERVPSSVPLVKGSKTGLGRIIPASLDMLGLFTEAGLDPVLSNAAEGKYLVRCPNESMHSAPGKSGSVIWHGNASRRDGFYCAHSHCQGLNIWNLFPRELIEAHCEREELAADGLVLKIKQTEPSSDLLIPEAPREIITVAQRAYEPPKRDAKERVPAFVKAFLKTEHVHGVLRTPEGYGKSSMIVQTLVNMGRKVLFCSSSNKQVQEKALSFGARYRTVRAMSFGAVFEEQVGVKPVYEENIGFEVPALDEELTLELVTEHLNCTEVEAKEALEEMKAVAVMTRHVSNDVEVVCSTFELGNVLARTPAYREFVIVVDDPNTGNLLLSRYGMDTTGAPFVLCERPVEDTPFALCREGQKVIWTTTEDLVLRIIRQHHGRVFVRNVDESIATDDAILVVPSKLVRKTLKPVLKSINAYLEETRDESWDFIANGVGAELNLVSTKGRNDMVHDQTIVLSYPHPYEVMAVMAALGVAEEDFVLSQAEVTVQMTVDVLDQAIGRAQGYRRQPFDTQKTLLIVDPQLETAIKCRSRYEIKGVDGMKRRGRLNGVPVTIQKLNDFWITWLSYLTAWEKYVVQIGDKIYNTLNLQPIDNILELEAVKKLLKSSVKKSDWAWKSIDQVMEPDEGRKNILLEIEELLKEENEHGHVGRTRADTSKRNKKFTTSGNITFVNANGEKFIAKVGEQVPIGFKFKNKRLQYSHGIDKLGNVYLKTPKVV